MYIIKFTEISFLNVQKAHSTTSSFPFPQYDKSQEDVVHLKSYYFYRSSLLFIEEFSVAAFSTFWKMMSSGMQIENLLDLMSLGVRPPTEIRVAKVSCCDYVSSIEMFDNLMLRQHPSLQSAWRSITDRPSHIIAVSCSFDFCATHLNHP